MKFLKVIILLTLILISCDKEFNEITQQESQLLVLKGERGFLFADYVNEMHNPLNAVEKSSLNQSKSYRIFQLNSNNKISKVVVKPITHDSQLINELKLINFTNGHPLRSYSTQSIDCDSLDLDSIYHDAFRRDQMVRTSSDKETSNIISIDSKNQDEIIPILINCGWPTTSEEVIKIWHIIQHSDIDLMCYYYNDFQKLTKAGLLPDSLFAKTYDRILTRSGLPQYYGTQKAGGNTDAFHPIKDVGNVNERRKEMGLCPIEQKARYWGFEFVLDDYLIVE